MKTQAALTTLILSVAAANADQAQEQHANNRQLRGLSGSCGFVPPSCCCIDEVVTCVTALCERVAANNGVGLPCGGGDYYTVTAGDQSEIICMGEGGGDLPPSTALSRTTCAGEGVRAQDCGAKNPSHPVSCCEGYQCDGKRCRAEEGPNRGNEEDEETLDITDPNDTEPAKCSIGNWNLEGRGTGYECTSNDNCMYGCCSTGHIEGKCISPFINPSFVDFLGCMPEFSECELNRVGTSSPYTDDDGQLESEYLVGIDSCQPSNPAASGVTKCCSTSSECAGFGEECCDQVRLQCVPTLGSEDIISLLQCL